MTPIKNDPFAALGEAPSFSVTSNEVADGRPLTQAQYSGIMGVPGGQDVSPHLAWSGAPKGTLSYMVMTYDPDAETPSGFWHWCVVDIPASVTELPRNAGAEGGSQLPQGAYALHNDAGKPAFLGAAPPAGDEPHRYYFIVLGLDVRSLNLPKTTTPAFMNFNAWKHILGRGVLVTLGEVPAPKAAAA